MFRCVDVTANPRRVQPCCSTYLSQTLFLFRLHWCSIYPLSLSPVALPYDHASFSPFSNCSAGLLLRDCIGTVRMPSSRWRRGWPLLPGRRFCRGSRTARSTLTTTRSRCYSACLLVAAVFLVLLVLLVVVMLQQVALFYLSGGCLLVPPPSAPIKPPV